LREIKFRGKRIDNSEFAYGFYNGIPDSNIVFINDKSEVDCSPVDPETVGQLSGLPDKHGTPIYEDDIQEFSNGYRAVVEFKNGMFGINPVRNLDENAFIELAIYLDTDEEGNALNIVGNIHDNPELLQEA